MGTNGCPQEALAARQRESRQAMPTAPGIPAAPSDPAMAVKAQVTARRHQPTARCPAVGSRAIVRCLARIASRPDPVAGIGLGHGARTSGGCGTAPGPGSEAWGG